MCPLRTRYNNALLVKYSINLLDVRHIVSGQRSQWTSSGFANQRSGKVLDSSQDILKYLELNNIAPEV